MFPRKYKYIEPPYAAALSVQQFWLRLICMILTELQNSFATTKRIRLIGDSSTAQKDATERYVALLNVLSVHAMLCVKLHLRDGRTNGWTDKQTRLFVRCVSQGVHSMEERTAMLRRNLRGGGG